MTPRSRLAVGLSLIPLGYFASEAVRELVKLSHNPGIRVAVDMLGIETGLAFLAVGLAVALPGSPIDRLGLRRSRLHWSALAAIVLGTLGLSAAIDAAMALTRATEGSKVVGMSRDLAQIPWTAVAIGIFGSALAPGICEEILCRGLVQRSLARWAPPFVAVVAAALFFGWLHQEWVHGSIATAIGLYLGVAALWADSTRPAILAHFANNLLALLGSMGLVRLHLTSEQGLLWGPLLAVAGLAWIWRCRSRAPTPPTPTGGDSAALQLDSESADS